MNGITHYNVILVRADHSHSTVMYGARLATARLDAVTAQAPCRAWRKEQSACTIVAMDAAEIFRIASTLMGAVTEAQALALQGRVGRKFRELIRDGRQRHDLLLETLLAHPSLSTAYLHEISESCGNALDQFEALTGKATGARTLTP